MSELKPCPVCGGRAAIEEQEVCLNGESWSSDYYVACEDKGCLSTDVFPVVEEAISVWNTRHTPEGYVMVPVEPTEEIINAGVPDIIGEGIRPIMEKMAVRRYKAMIAAAQEVSNE